MNVLCDICAKSFEDIGALNKHLKTHEPRKGNVKRVVCDICGKSFYGTGVLNRHLKTHEPRKTNIKRIKVCPVCRTETEDLQTHVFEVHNIKVEQESNTFSNFTEFIEWKAKVERETQSVYVKKSGTKRRKNGGSTTYYFCHRDGKYVSKGKNKRSLKKIGSNKIDAYCTSYMKVQGLPNETVIVTFVSTHVGHSCDANRMPLSKADKDRIASQISMKIPLNNILDEIRNSVEGEPEKIRKITKQDLRNIVAGYKLNQEKIDENDIDAIEEWVNHMNKTCKLVRLYKPEGKTINEFPELKSEDFCLILSNNMQIDCLNHFGNNILCVVGTNDVAGYNCQMFSLVVLDEIGDGCPCAFLFTNRCDKIIMELFFKTVISCAKNNIEPKYLMTDIDDVFYNAWCTAFPNSCTKHLYCEWLVDKEWRKNLIRIKTDQMRAEVYMRVKELVNEKDKATFDTDIKDLLGELFCSPLTIRFAKYFETYVQEPSKWAYCYRVPTAANTDTVLERLHKNLNHIFAAGKKHKQLIKSIHALYGFQSRFRMTSSFRGNVKRKLFSIKRRHKISESLSFDSVHNVTDDEWIVFSSTLTETYTVLRLENVCDCELRCEQCNVCIHSYCCTCTDSAVLWTMCKHIHLVCRRNFDQLYLNPNTEQLDFNNADEEQPDWSPVVQQLADDTSVIVEQLPNNIGMNVETRKKQQLENITRILNEITTDAEMEVFENVISPLQALLDAVRQETSVQNSTSEVEVALNEPVITKKLFCREKELKNCLAQDGKKKIVRLFRKPPQGEARIIEVQDIGMVKVELLKL